MNRFVKIIREYSRAREERIGEQIKESDPKHSNPIAHMIDNAIKRGSGVWVTTDWHLWKFDKQSKSCSKRKEFDKILQNYKDNVKDKDIVIHLGDLCDGEYEDKKSLGEVLMSLPGTKILVRGNNDLFPDSWYLEHGFRYVTPKFVWDNILFTHIPETNPNKLNVHGHIHNFKTYWIPYTNHIDVAYLDGRIRPVPLDQVIAKQHEYATHAKTVKSKIVEEWSAKDPFND